MTPAAVQWFKEHSNMLVASSMLPAVQGDTFSVLSIGCGEGDIDLEIIQSLLPHLEERQICLKYEVIEPNAVHHQVFLERLEEASLPDMIEVRFHDGYFGDTAEIQEQYNLVLLVHVLYYFQEPYDAIQQALTHTKAAGNVIVVHQEETGIPQIQRRHMLDVKGDEAELLTTADIHTLLTDNGHAFAYHSVEAHLDITESLAGTEQGIKIMSFCMECDLRYLQNGKLERLTHAFKSLAVVNGGEQALLREPIGVFIVPAFPAARSPEFRAPTDHDPVQDYWQLAKSYRWSDLLFRADDDEQLRILDVACGSGRWLRALQLYAQPKPGSTRMIYDFLDPNAEAMVGATQQLQLPFQVGEQFAQTIQEAALARHTYDLLWSMHGFYIIPHEELGSVLTKCAGLLKSGGTGFIGLATLQSFYVDFYARYLDCFYPGQGGRFTAAEDVVEALVDAGMEHHVDRIFYEELIHHADHAALEHYIRAESSTNSFDKSMVSDGMTLSQEITLDKLMSHPQLGAYLDSMRRGAYYAFPQEIWLISFGAKQ